MSNEGSGQFRMDARSSLNFANFEGLDIRKFRLMSRGFEGRGLEPEDVI